MSPSDNRRRVLQAGTGLVLAAFLPGLGFARGAQANPAPPQSDADQNHPATPNDLSALLEAQNPALGRIVFDVLYGKAGVRVGETEHLWHQAHGNYRMEARVRSSGLLALFRDFNYVQRSEGRFSASGFIPERFRVDQSGKPSEIAVFDWSAARVEIRRGDGIVRHAELHPGDQDVLSLWHQLSLLGEQSIEEVLVVTNKSAKPVRIAWQESERLQLPLGELPTRRVRAAATDNSLALDLWLSETHQLLPVRVRMSEASGQLLDQRARSITLPSAESSQ